MLDSPGLPASANAHQLFKGFSFVATSIAEEYKITPVTSSNVLPIVQVSSASSQCSVSKQVFISLNNGFLVVIKR